MGEIDLKKLDISMEYLRRMADGKNTANKKKKEFPLEQLEKYSYRNDLGISNFVVQINENLDETTYKKLSYTKITNWLKAMGYLDVIEDKATDKKKTLPSEKGRQLSIYTEERENFQGRKYDVTTGK